MRGMRILAAERIERPDGSVLWRVVKQLVDNRGDVVEIPHVFPAGAVEWRMAEYDLNDVDEALRVVLYEPHLGPDPRPDLGLYQAPSVAEAREHHLGRVAELAERAPLTEVPGPDRGARVAAARGPLETLRAGCAPDPERIAEKRQRVARGRRALGRPA